VKSPGTHAQNGPTHGGKAASTSPLADQDRYAPNSICFGCGPANAKGLRIKSHWEDGPQPGLPTAGARPPGADGPRFVMEFRPEPHHQAFPGVVNGGILGTLLDCHSNWCAATALMHKWNWDAPQCTVTADFHVKLRRPTPIGKPVRLEAKVESITEDRATIHCDLLCDGKLTATCDGTFVAVKEGHPAWHRWG
jgi:acyl-coenzyme A thioesterase PaaI-like protein